MAVLNRFIAGLGGAIALNILHEVIRKNSDGDVPRLNEVAGEALKKGLKKTSFPTSNEDKVYAATLAGDLVSNTMYYAGLATANNNKGLIGKSITSGLLAGLGAVGLPDKLGLNSEPVAGTSKQKMMTVGYYVFGAVVTAAIYKFLNDKHPRPMRNRN